MLIILKDLGYNLVVDYLLTICEALGPIPRRTKGKKEGR